MDQLERNRRVAAVRIITGCSDSEKVTAFVRESNLNPLEAPKNDVKADFDLFSLKNHD